MPKKRKAEHKEEPKGEPKGEKKIKADDNSIVNSLTTVQITDIVTKFYTEKYTRDSRGKKPGGEASRLDCPIPYLHRYCQGGRDHLVVNPYAFGWTMGFMRGYPTYPVKGTAIVGVTAPPSTTTKSTWHPRVPVHGILWRYYNGFATIPEDKQVSHVTDQPLLVTPSLLVLETGPVNRSRSACREQGWYKQRFDATGEPRLRCPHWEAPCQDPVELPPLDFFKSEAISPISNKKDGPLLLSSFSVPLVNKL
jgi:hypothetical protein